MSTGYEREMPPVAQEGQERAAEEILRAVMRSPPGKKPRQQTRPDCFVDSGSSTGLFSEVDPLTDSSVGTQHQQLGGEARAHHKAGGTVFFGFVPVKGPPGVLY